jgi:HD-GYP domain-containing protein (c-di-GMP phosphodiesterase class II)
LRQIANKAGNVNNTSSEADIFEDMTPEYCEISIENFFNMKGEMPFDVFIKIGDAKYTKIFKKSDQIDRSRFEIYSQKGVQQLFILRSERREYIAATERLVQKILQQKDLATVEARKAIEELSQQTLFEIYEDRVFDEETIRRAQTTVKVYVNLVNSDVRTLASFINLARQETYLCRHSIATSIFGVLLARAADNVNEKVLSIVGLGGLLHDIGMSKLPPAINDVDRKLTPQEWALVKSHPKVACQMIDGISAFPAEVKTAIEQHHEYWNGKGYPRGIKGEEIFYPARVIAIADSFSALTTRRAGRALYSPEDAVALMMTEEGKYDSKLMKIFATLLGASRVKKSA